MKNFNAVAVLTVLALGFSLEGRAQDMRRVSEPKVPPVCVKLTAEIAAPQGIEAVDETKLDTVRVQKALDECRGKNKAVELSSFGRNDAFLTGQIRLHKGVILLVDKDVTLYGSRNPADYEYKPGSCGVVSDTTKGCRALINVYRAPNSGVMGEGTIDGRGGAKLLLAGVEQPKTWWDIADDARKVGHPQVPRIIQTNRTSNFTAYQITLKNSASVHLGFHNGTGMTAWGVRIDAPKNTRLVDGISAVSAKNVTITLSYIRTGDDDVALKAGRKPTRNVSVTHNHFYWGHGMSIGLEMSGGVKDVYVSDLTLDGPDNGLRIKSGPSRGGLVQEILYDNVCVRKSKAPILLETAFNKPGDTKTKEPVYRDIVLHNVRIEGGGRVQLLGLDATHRIGIQFDGVMLTDPTAKYRYAANHADITLGPGPVNFQMTGEDSTVRGSLGGGGELDSCDARWVPFPVTKSAPAQNAVSSLPAKGQ